MKKTAFCIIGVLLTILLHFIGALKSVEGVIARGLEPLFAYGRAIALGKDAERTDSILAQTVVDLQKNLAVCTTARQENASLKEMIGYRERSDASLIPSQVLGASTDPLRSMVVIDRGSADGVEKGSAVIVNDGVLVGRVAVVHTYSSSVMLLNDSRSKVIATFATDDHPHGIVEGQFQLGLRMNLIPITDTVKEGTVVMTSGREQGIPPSLVIGAISSIQSKPTDLFQSALIRPSVSYDTLRFVSVIPLE